MLSSSVDLTRHKLRPADRARDVSFFSRTIMQFNNINNFAPSPVRLVNKVPLLSFCHQEIEGTHVDEKGTFYFTFLLFLFRHFFYTTMEVFLFSDLSDKKTSSWLDCVLGKTAFLFFFFSLWLFSLFDVFFSL